MDVCVSKKQDSNIIDVLWDNKEKAYIYRAWLGIENGGGRGMGTADWGPYVRESWNWQTKHNTTD